VCLWYFFITICAPEFQITFRTDCTIIKFLPARSAIVMQERRPTRFAEASFCSIRIVKIALDLNKYYGLLNEIKVQYITALPLAVGPGVRCSHLTGTAALLIQSGELFFRSSNKFGQTINKSAMQKRKRLSKIDEQYPHSKLRIFPDCH
jgi:hypothetical protein